MADSLRDQLVKAGLATANQAKKAERQARAEKQAQQHREADDPPADAKKARGKKKPASDPSTAASVRARAKALNAAKTEHNRALARVTNEKAAAKALRAEIKQIIVQNDQRKAVSDEDGVPYNFVHGKKIKRLYVPRAQQEQLSAGSLVIVNNDGLYHLVSREVAAQISARDPKRIIASHNSDDKKQEADSTPDDDYYAKFQVPDDLDW